MNHFSFSIKSFDDQIGVVEGLASTYSNVDRQGDAVMPGAFSKSLAVSGGRVPLLWQHDQRTPIGLAHLADGAAGLRIKAQLDLESPDGIRAYSAVKKQYVTAFSIGYDTVKATVKNGVRQLHELTLWEVSLVTIPANAAATVTSVKEGEIAADLAPAQELTHQLQELVHETGMRAVLAQMRALTSALR